MSLCRKQLCDTSWENRSIDFERIILGLEVSPPERISIPILQR